MKGPDARAQDVWARQLVHADLPHLTAGQREHAAYASALRHRDEQRTLSGRLEQRREWLERLRDRHAHGRWPERRRPYPRRGGVHVRHEAGRVRDHDPFARGVEYRAEPYLTECMLLARAPHPFHERGRDERGEDHHVGKDPGEDQRVVGSADRHRPPVHYRRHHRNPGRDEAAERRAGHPEPYRRPEQQREWQEEESRDDLVLFDAEREP